MTSSSINKQSAFQPSKERGNVQARVVFNTTCICAIRLSPWNASVMALIDYTVMLEAHKRTRLEKKTRVVQRLAANPLTRKRYAGRWTGVHG